MVLNILLKNTTEDIITYYPSGNMVIEKLHARNGVTLQEPDKMTVTVMPERNWKLAYMRILDQVSWIINYLIR